MTKRLTLRALLCAALLSAFAVALSDHVRAADCASPVLVDNATSPGIISISSNSISSDQMTRLWSIATSDPEDSTPFFGRIIAADQNWLGSCAYPGIGIGAGSGYTERVVWLFVWATGVDLAVAKQSVIAAMTPVTTTTTIAPTTTTTTAPPVTTTTVAVTTTATPVTTTTAVEAIAVEAVIALRYIAAPETTTTTTPPLVTNPRAQSCKVSVVKIRKFKAKKLILVRKKVCK